MDDCLTFDQVLVQKLAFLVQIWIQQVKFVQKTKLKPKKAYKCDGDTKRPKKDVHGRFFDFCPSSGSELGFFGPDLDLAGQVCTKNQTQTKKGV